LKRVIETSDPENRLLAHYLRTRRKLGQGYPEIALDSAFMMRCSVLGWPGVEGDDVDGKGMSRQESRVQHLDEQVTCLRSRCDDLLHFSRDADNPFLHAIL
jgi:hypothetical protein